MHTPDEGNSSSSSWCSCLPRVLKRAQRLHLIGLSIMGVGGATDGSPHIVEASVGDGDCVSRDENSIPVVHQSPALKAASPLNIEYGHHKSALIKPHWMSAYSPD